MGISMQDALNNRLIGYTTYNILPKMCRCGKELYFSDSLKTLKCNNKDCKSALLFRIEEFCLYNSLSLSRDSILNIIDSIGIKSPFQILELGIAYKNKIITELEVPNILEILDDIEDIKCNTYELYQLFEMCGDRTISLVAKALVYGYDTVDEVYRQIKQGQVCYIAERLGIESLDISSLAYNIYLKIDALYEEMVYIESLLSVKKYENKLHIAFNDTIGTFLNKRELLVYLEDTFNYKFIHTEVITEEVDILVKHINNNSYKYKKAMEINDIHSAKLINSGEIDLDDIGQFKDNELKPIGSKIYIDSIDNIIKRLRIMKSSKT